MELKRLHSDVITKTRSCFTLNNVCQCVLELVLNSLDAKATAIAVRINLVTLRIQVVDNGEGILKENMKNLGLRYFTSKCKNKEELEGNYKNYGFRGEALANIAQLSKSVDVTSRHKNSVETYTKTIDKDKNVEESITKQRPSIGTTVTVSGLFHNLPVRRKRIVAELELDEIKTHIKSLIIINPTVSFSLRDDITTELILNSRKTDDIASAFTALHPDYNNGTVMKITKGTLSIISLLFKNLTEDKKLQYIYVNKRPIYSAKIQKFIQKIFIKNLKTRYNNNNKKYPIYVLNIKCPYTDVDILLNPTKTLADFKNWDRVEHCIEKIINLFFGNNTNTTKKPISEIEQKKNSECGVSKIHGAVRAYGYKRKNNTSNIDIKNKVTKIDEISTKQPKDVITKENNLSEDDDICDIIEETPVNKKQKNNLKQPLPITILPSKNKEKPYPIINNNKSKNIHHKDDTESKFASDESKGKNLILDMFLKSTQIYKSNETIENSQNSAETEYEEESNILLENNVKTIFNGVSKTMSMSVNLKSTKKIKRRKNNKTDEKCIQTTLDNKKTSKGLQTTLNDDIKSSILEDNYTIVFSDHKKARFKLRPKKSEPGSFEFAYKDNCSCTCRGNNLFNFAENDRVNILPSPNLIDNINISSSEPVKTKSCVQCQWKIKKKTDKKSNVCEQSPYFKSKPLIESNYNFRYNTNFLNKRNSVQNYSNYWDMTVGSFEQFRPVFKSTQQNQNMVEQWLNPNHSNKIIPVDRFSNFNLQYVNTKNDNNSKSLINPIPTELLPQEVKKTLPQEIGINLPQTDSNINENCKLEITMSETEKHILLEKELLAEKSMLLKEFFEWNSQFSPEGNCKSNENEWNWTRREHFGNHFYINKKTGFATYNTPKANTFFQLGKRYEFLPKGMSPIMRDVKKVDMSLSQNGKNTLLEYLVETYKADLMFVKWQHYIKDVDSKTFFDNLYKEKVRMYETLIPNTVINKISDTINLNKDLFKNVEIIGQLDRKFIVVRDTNENLLLLFDQHAVHERIRLEGLLKIYKSSKSKCKEKMIIFVPQNELSLLKRSESYLNYIGMSVEFFRNGVYVTEVPLCLSLKFRGADSANAFNESIHILIKEVIELLKSTRGVSLKILPRLVRNIINMEACRGAIKFGDSLNKKQCEELLKKLASTELPFQCAHGRPTVTPLLKLSDNLEEERSLNFKKVGINKS